MHIGIITFHCSDNYGSVLQAYALSTYLKSMGNTVQVINYYSDDARHYRLLFCQRNDRRQRAEFAKGFGYHAVVREWIKDAVFFRRRRKRAEAFRKFRESNLELTEKMTCEEELAAMNGQFDAFICGSDQIWNLDCTNGITAPFFLSFAQKPRIAYGVSLGHEKFSVTYDENVLRALLNRFAAISVREGAAVPWLRQYTDLPIATVADPTLLLPQTAYTALERPFRIKSPYVLCYFLHEPIPWQIGICREYAKTHRVKIIHFFVHNEFGMPVVSAYGCTPGQWLYLLRNAQFILTDSFHAMLFSLIYEKPFSILSPGKSAIRQEDLLCRLGLEHRFYRAGSTFRMDTDDLTKVREAMNREAMAGTDFLQNALKKAEGSHE